MWRNTASMSPVDKSSMLWARDAISDLKSAPETFSSWDKCMAKSYCKWPVIVAIIVAAVIIIAILACVINCLCCGIQCCTGCCRCLSCCCPSPRKNKGSRKQYMDDVSPYHQPPPPMPQATVYQPPPPVAPPTYRGAQIARFDTPSSPAASKTGFKVNEDALPEMPTWDNARTRRVEDTSSPRPEDMEMEPLNQPRRSPSVPRSPASFMGPPARTGTTPSFYGEQNIHARRSPGPQSPPAATAPLSPYDEPYGDYPYGMSPPGPTPAPAPYAPRQYTPMPSISPAPAAYTPSQYTPMPSTISTPDPVPYRQPSPGVAVPYRQPSPGPGMPFRQPSPGPGVPFRQPSPGPGVPFRQQSPAVPFRQPSPGFPQPPSYRGLSPAASPASPPPAFSETNNGPGRPPSLLQSGRKPSVNF